MGFLNKTSHDKRMVDKVFAAAVQAKEAATIHGEDQVVNATLGTLFNEDGTFVAFDSVWTPYRRVTDIAKAKYAASIQGNPTFREAVHQWLFQTTDIPCEIVATPGGAGAVSATMKNMLDPGMTVLKPSLAWGPYQTMAAEFGLLTQDYNLFHEGGFDTSDFLRQAGVLMERQGKVLAIVNDPCHNPSGYTMTNAEWDAVIQGLGELAEQGPVILLHDIAYVDFTNDPNWKDGLRRYQTLPDNLMVVIAFSLSKTFTAYGMRVGAAIAITNDPDERHRFRDAMVYSARSIWSTVNNSIMELFASISSTPVLLADYQAEKATYVSLLQERANVFLTEATEVGLPVYPYRDGFFVTIPVLNERKCELNQRLAQNNIFLVEVAHGLRVALCSVPKHKLKGLAARIQSLLQ